MTFELPIVTIEECFADWASNTNSAGFGVQVRDYVGVAYALWRSQAAQGKPATWSFLYRVARRRYIAELRDSRGFGRKRYGRDGKLAGRVPFGAKTRFGEAMARVVRENRKLDRADYEANIRELVAHGPKKIERIIDERKAVAKMEQQEARILRLRKAAQVLGATDVLELTLAGYNMRQVSSHTGVSLATVCRQLKRIRKLAR